MLQDKVLKEFQNAYGKRSYQEYADILGMDKTRIFRLFNGFEMKLQEYEKFEEHTSLKKMPRDEVLASAKRQLSREGWREIICLAERKLSLKNILINSEETIILNKLA
jgi:hypothetical protein